MRIIVLAPDIGCRAPTEAAMPFDASRNSVAHHVLFYGPALREKSRLLGGPLAEARTGRLIADIGDEPSLSERRSSRN